MVATVEPKVEIDDRIRENPDLLTAVTEAMAYLGRHVNGVPLPVAIQWRPLPLDPNSIELLMSDTLDFSDMVARRVFPVLDLTDAYTREVGTLRTWRSLLRRRSEKNWLRIDELMERVRRAAEDENEDKSKNH